MNAKIRWNEKAKVKYYVCNNEIGVELTHQFFLIKPKNRYTIAYFEIVKKDVLTKKVITLNQLLGKHHKQIEMVYIQKRYWLDRNSLLKDNK